MSATFPDSNPFARPLSSSGGKASGLQWLTDNRYSVPPWFWIPLEILAGNQISGEFNPAFIAEIIKYCETAIGTAPYGLAIRSSAASEDGIASSCAGQMQTILGVSGPIELADALKICLRSILDFQKQEAVSSAVPSGSIIIQRMLAPDFSGVAFSADPSSGDRTHALISSCSGLGQPLTAGEITPDEYRVSNTGFIVHTMTGEPMGQTTIVLGGRIIPVEKTMKSGLSEANTRRVAALVRDISKGRNCPQDIEWSLVGSDLYVLQARPITRLPECNDKNTFSTAFDNSNIEESYCGVSTPLTFSFARKAYERVYLQTMEVLKISRKKREEMQPYMANLLGLVEGRIYYNIRNWHRGLLLFPAFDLHKSDMEKMMGVSEPVDFVEDTKKSWLEKLRRLSGVLKAISSLSFGFFLLPLLVKRFHSRTDRRIKHARATDLTTLTACDIFYMLSEFKDKLLQDWHVPIINDFNVMMRNGKLARYLTEQGLDKFRDAVNQALAIDPNLASARPAYELSAIARQASENPDVVAAIQSQGVADFMGRIAVLDPILHRRCIDFIDQYGDRTIGELKLETVTMRLDHNLLAAYLRPLLTYNENPLRRAELPTAVTGHRRFNLLVNRLRDAIRWREEMRFTRTKVFGVVRDCYVEIGRRFSHIGLIGHPADIFYLTEGDIGDIFSGSFYGSSPKHLILQRKSEYESYKDKRPSGHIYVNGIPNGLASSTGRVTIEGNLRGTGCSPGIASGPVVKVECLKMDLDLGGKILCAQRTDPGWAPLFPAVRGILIEKGSTLSHSAIIARELA
jgi:pyruvate,water dikinase